MSNSTNEQIDEILKPFECKRPDCNGGHLMEQNTDGEWSDYAQCYDCHELDEARGKLQRLMVEVRIKQSYRCKELVEANANSPEDEERYGEIVLLDVDDLEGELKGHA